MDARSDPFPAAALDAHVACLEVMLRQPRRSSQRLVEQLTFLPNGGQSWRRTLQMQIPPEAEPADAAWRAVSLGAFRRRRFPDLMAYDAHGHRLSLLTRHQHGTLLTAVFLTKHLRAFPLQIAAAETLEYSPAYHAYNDLVSAAYALLTSAGDLDNQAEANRLSLLYGRLLSLFDPLPDRIGARVSAFRTDFASLLVITHYLCWIYASPGDVIIVETTHTVADDLHAKRAEKPVETPDTTRSLRWRRLWMRWYREVGLAPLNLRVLLPGNGLTTSYYFTVAPPPKTDITFLDWSVGNSIEDDKTELDSSLHSVHFHYGHNAGLDSTNSTDVLTYLRCATSGHKQIAGGALLNLVFVLLVVTKGFSGTISNSAQAWLLITPTILTAYIADQQRHYYAYATRRQRAILWIYLAISVAFLVSASFHLAQGPADEGHWNWFGTLTAWLLVVSSAAVFAWYALLGYSFRVLTTWRVTKALENSRTKLDAGLRELKVPAARRERLLTSLHSPGLVYDRVVYNYCRVVSLLVLVAILGGVLLMKFAWGTPRNGNQSHHTTSAPTLLYTPHTPKDSGVDRL